MEDLRGGECGRGEPAPQGEPVAFGVAGDARQVRQRGVLDAAREGGHASAAEVGMRGRWWVWWVAACSAGEVSAPAAGAAVDAGGEVSGRGDERDAVQASDADAAPPERDRDATADAAWLEVDAPPREDVPEAPGDVAIDDAVDALLSGEDVQDTASIPEVQDADWGTSEIDDAGGPDPADVGADVADVAPFDPGPEPCAEVAGFGPQFDGELGVFQAQDAVGGWPASNVVFVGSSSIRRWESLARVFTDYAPIQRGLGGIQLGEVALRAQALVTSHAPRGVVVYAGTNDLAAGVAPEVVLGRLACLRWRIGAALGWSTPVIYVGVTPNPARWAQWPTAAAFNAAAAAMAVGDPGLRVLDVAPPFLATGQPPAASLFDPDGLHLSAQGYALWDGLVRGAVEAALPPEPPPVGTPVLPAETRLLVDVGPSNPEDGELTPSPDYQGNHWNNWQPLEGGGMALAGEQLVDLRTSTGAPTGVDLVIAGGFLANGRQNGGLLWPDPARLGVFAVGSATGDFFYVENADAPGALWFRGLEPGRAVTVRLFAAREADEVRVTRFTVQGQSATLQTSGPGAGADGAVTNDDTIVSLDAVVDAWGNLHVDVAKEQGSFAYLSALELVVH